MKPHSNLIAVACLILAPTASAQPNLLTNQGFETGDFTGWQTSSPPGAIVSQTAATGCGAISPPTPFEGSFFHSSAVADGTPPLTPSITLSQTIAIPTCDGIQRAAASCRLAAAPGCGSSSDDTAQIHLEFLQGGSSLGTVSSTVLDPVAGTWTLLSIPPTEVPPGADTVIFRFTSTLDKGFASIDIGFDDAQLTIECFCEADWNSDGIQNTADFVAYLNDFTAVMNGSSFTFADPDIAAPIGVLNTADFVAFLNAYNAGCNE